MILVTGSEGLVGRFLAKNLEARGFTVKRFDIRRQSDEDIRNAASLETAIKGVSGVVHLAAVSRVLWGEQNPQLCHATNVEALASLLRLCLEQKTRPWLVFASSREVYGAQERLPVSEDASLKPMNVYARSKVDGECLVNEARGAGLHANICRLSNVYGCPLDHPDRVTMAFASAAARGGVMTLEGGSNTFDFTYVEDVADGIARLVEASMTDGLMPPIHFVGGQATSLRGLAELAAKMAIHPVKLSEAPPRDFDVGRFVGDPERAKKFLGWRASMSLETGFARLVHELRDVQSAAAQ
jgi:UDP-glucose 4-epimerase